MNPKAYREHLHQQRSHPQNPNTLLGKDNFSALYFSLFGFLAAEYFAELNYERLPSGIFFPVSFLFFWAFYYTYCQPGYLEKRLSSEKKWDLFGIPATLVSCCIWFVKIVFVELTEKVIGNLLGTKPKTEAPKRAAPRSAGAHSKPHGPSHAHSQSRPLSSPPPLEQETLPREIKNALQILGVPHAREWAVVQRRYRELAKQYHPDLNPDLTQNGNRFMIYDAAYRKLEQVKLKYFEERKRS